MSGVAAYRAIGPYGDGPFGGGFRRIASPDGRGSTLVRDFEHAGQTVRAVIDERSRRASELRFDLDADGLHETLAHIDPEQGGVRLERDLDADGVTDRWEHYAGLTEFQAGRVEKVGFSLAADGVEDAWAFHGADGRLVRLEVSTRRDGVVDRWEHYEDGSMVRAESDDDGDGRADTWSTYVNGILAATGAAPGDDESPAPNAAPADP